MHWAERQLERLRSIDPLVADAALAAFLALFGIVSVFTQEISDGLTEPTGLAVLTTVVVVAPVVVRRRYPLAAVTVSSLGTLVHVAADWPEGTLPPSVMLLAYSVAAWDTPVGRPSGLAWSTPR